MFTVSDISKLLNVSIKTVRSLIRSGQMRCVRLGHRTVRVTQKQFDDFVKENTH